MLTYLTKRTSGGAENEEMLKNIDVTSEGAENEEISENKVTSEGAENEEMPEKNKMTPQSAENEEVPENKVTSEGAEYETIYQLGNNERKSTDPVIVNLKINKVDTPMEVDTGATYTCMSTENYDKVGGSELGPPECQLKTYTGELVKPKGTGTVDVEYYCPKFGKQRRKLKVTVVDMKVPTLLGREWLSEIKLDWHQLFPVKNRGETAVVHYMDALKG